MKLKNLVIAALGVATLAATAAVSAQVIGKPEQQIRWRQSAYQTILWNVLRIKANLEGTYNKDQVIEAANVIQALANSKMGTLYQPGTDSGKGWRETNAKPELFKAENREELGKVGGAFNREANEMAKVAATGDLAAIKAQFEKLGKSCDGCHDKFRKEL